MPERPRRTYDLYSVQSATETAKHCQESTINLANNFEEDHDATKRKAALECKWCFYRSSVSGQALTGWICGRCGVRGVHSNTGVPCLCASCAKETGLCKQCMGHREGKMIRKLP